jgi:hypothetical protein
MCLTEDKGCCESEVELNSSLGFMVLVGSAEL